MSKASELQQLEYLSLVSKVTNELSNHIGISDKDVAEYIIHLHDDNKGYADFKQRLDQDECGFSEAFIQTLHRLITALKPKKEKTAAAEPATATEKASLFPGLSIPNKRNEEEKARNSAADRILASQISQNIDSLVGSARDGHRRGGDDRTRNRGHDGGRDEDRSRSPSRRRDSSADRRRSDRRGHDNHRHGNRSRSRSRSATRRRSRWDRPRDDDRTAESNSYRDRRARDNGHRDERESPADDAPVLYKIYQGRVSNLKDFGAFVSLDGVRGRTEGMVHVSAIQKNVRIGNPREVLERGQSVKVKVVSIVGNKLGLSMKDVDQETGADLTPHLFPGMPPEPQDSDRRRASEQSRPPAAAVSGSNAIKLGVPKSEAAVASGAIVSNGKSTSSSIKRLTSPERWEIKQLIASGALDRSDYPDLDEVDEDGLPAFEDGEEDLDIELREEEPDFLRGHTMQALQLSPVKVVKAPDGSLNRAAMAGAALAKERKELKQQQTEAELDNLPKDLNRPWEDPMPAPGERNFAQDLRGVAAEVVSKSRGGDVPEWKRAVQGKAVTYGKITDLSIQDQRKSLPVYKLREMFVEAVDKHQFLVAVGDTGSGKTTQLTQYLYEEGFTRRGRIGCTQPRRVAATSVAKRVAEEVGCRLGTEVGYTIRYEDCTSPETKIKYCTEGMLIREVLLDSELKRYSVIMLDEAHERGVNTDVLFGLLKETCRRRPDLKVIVTSATLDAEKFSKYFNNCPIFTIPGRTFPVEVLFSREPETDYLDSALMTVMQIHLTEPPGDILLFLTGQEEIDTASEILYERIKALGSMVPELIILPVYSSLPSDMQSRIFEPAPPGTRKIVISTNIAETSVTIDGIYYVVDPGFVKQKTYDSKSGLDQLVVTPISQAQAKQRSGRAGRTGPGKCYRLYTESAFRNEMLPNSVPEIQRVNLASTVLQLKAMGINDLIGFDFMDPPPVQTLIASLELLHSLGALDSEGLLTRIGRKMAEFPMSPELAKALLASVELGCSEEVLTIAAMLSAEGTIFYRPREKQAAADSKKAKFHQPEGDHLTLLAVYNSWSAAKFSNTWCFENYLQYRRLRSASDIRKQMVGIMDRYKQDIVSCGERNFDPVRRALCAGFFRHAAKRDPQEGYKTLVEGTPVHIHPSSALFNKNPEWVIYHELIMTSKEYMREVTVVEAKWLVEVAPTFFKVADANKISRRKRNERLEPLYNKFEKPNEWRISRVRKPQRGKQTFG
ncbi:DEAH-box ATP-dependent RNA helicase prp22 [Coemansia thaxteri]|uniref:RNA helicase n=1 Tax=Coemansia thaxteri TaxID=2663907 RepID=A0A9W8BG51_9FUNG|nr:DEAH-box ATP-dependent RNA helicase prp22 [Coemansia thaxteri]KAJ2009007.1 DEAH-box ATP-dependent RNA helicase prp22 [Coemansia thaxteri]KAJ2473237.1 DEAH-box ATP-dependent RNA helicase prp22 [Coemansia sp. RSA 2322]KAJ2485698.1 DEAH-box ATP-dependent RNA helicase prp22 [Coemansia sp. RSA 2320]